jgi:glucosamine-6-phosphate deaminase
MNVVIAKSTEEMAAKAAARAAEIIRRAIRERGEARIILATGASQFGFLKALTAAPDIDWPRVTGFHLDEYVGLPATHKASFRGYMRRRFVGALPVPPKAFNEVNGEAADTAAEIARLTRLLDAAPIDVACVGIGENGHLAFNDPPADFETDAAYVIVNLDRVCRMQQVGEGWFAKLEDVPRQAFSMSIRRIMASRAIVCTVPDARKAKAVQGAVDGPVTNLCPSSILQTHPDCAMFLDPAAAGLLKGAPGSKRSAS